MKPSRRPARRFEKEELLVLLNQSLASATEPIFARIGVVVKMTARALEDKMAKYMNVTGQAPCWLRWHVCFMLCHVIFIQYVDLFP